MKERNLIEDIQKTNFINKRTSECREREPRRATTGRWAWLLGMPRGYWECWGGREHTGAGRGSGGGRSRKKPRPTEVAGVSQVGFPAARTRGFCVHLRARTRRAAAISRRLYLKDSCAQSGS